MAACLTPLSHLPRGRRAALARLPRSLVILLENVLAHEAEPEPFIASFEQWLAAGRTEAELPFRPSRILMQDTAGVAALADLAALRDHAAAHGHDPAAVDAAIPIDLVIDHSVKVDHSGVADAARLNHALEFARNAERYGFFKWAEQAFPKLRVIPPGQGICHQVNLESLTRGAVVAPGQTRMLMAETVIGTDSHTTMANALGVLGWGVGGIEAELAALGRPVPTPLPEVCQVVLTGRRRPEVTATDVALHVTARLRAAGVVDTIVEFTGPGVADLSLPDRAAVANMCPEYGATAGLFAVDEETLAYLAAMGRDADEVAAYRAYSLASGLWHEGGERRYSRAVELPLYEVRPYLSGPSRPEQLRRLDEVAQSLRDEFPAMAAPRGDGPPPGALAVAAITSCTNTANPALMIAAGIVARKAVTRGLKVPGWVKTSLAPGSRRIAALLERSGLQASLDMLGFQVVGFGCTTCVGNSGELKPELTGPDAPTPLVALLSGNRNFENRIHPAIAANYLASPPLVVAGALVGHLGLDLSSDPLGTGADGRPVHLRELWPLPGEIEAVLAKLPPAEGMTDGTGAGDWALLPAPATPQFPWQAESSFIRRPPFFDHAPRNGDDIIGAKTLLVLGDSVTTDHVSPIGRIRTDSPAGLYLRSVGEAADRLGTYGDRRANHEVMVRGTFDNPRLANRLASASGNRTVGPDGAECSVYDAAMAHVAQGTSLVIIAGAHYGTGSARDWAAKGTALLGVRAVIARSFERIHRANLVALGVWPVVMDDDLPEIAPDSAISLLGLGDIGGGRREVRIEVARSDAAPMWRTGRVDVWSANQLDLLRTGGLFAAFRARFA